MEDLKLHELESLIVSANDNYRAGSPIMSDGDYDELMEELSKRDPDNPLLKKGVIEQSPTSRKVKLPIPMYSLDKLKSIQEVVRWLNSMGVLNNEWIVISPKLNGISFVVDIKNAFAATRGDGEYGQSCFNHLQKTGSRIDYESEYILFGEMIIPRKTWNEDYKDKISPKGQPYKLNHATVSGMFNSDEPDPQLKDVHFVKYGIAGGGAQEMSRINQLQLIAAHEGHSAKYFITEAKDLSEELLDNLYNEWNHYYPIDGLVIELNDPQKRQERETNMNPKYARAIKLDKWSGEQETVIIGHEFEISKQGKLKGVVKFKPIYFEGSEVSQATFYNAKFLINYGLSLGTYIIVKKSGDIIPKIVAVDGIRIPSRENFKNEAEFKEAESDAIKSILDNQSRYLRITKPDLENCPYCGNKLKWDENRVELLCDNHLNCEGIQLSKLEHFFVTAGIEEFGRPSITALYRAGYKTLKDILNISLIDLASIPGFGVASARIIRDQFDKLANPGISVAKAMHAMDVFEGVIGEKTAQLIIDELIDEFPNFKLESILKIKGVGQASAIAFLTGFDAFRDIINEPEYPMYINQVESVKNAVSGDRYLGWSVCFSGVRDKDLEDAIVSQGGKIASGVSKTTTHLIVADVSQNTSKTVKARELGIPILTIDQFKTL